MMWTKCILECMMNPRAIFFENWSTWIWKEIQKHRWGKVIGEIILIRDFHGFLVIYSENYYWFFEESDEMFLLGSFLQTNFEF